MPFTDLQLRPWRRGYSLQTVMILLAVVAGALSALLASVVTSGRTTGDVLQRRQGFYACDGIGRAFAVLAQKYVAEDPTPTSEELENYMCLNAGGCGGTVLLPTLTMEPFSLVDFTIELADVRNGMIPNGPFTGMNAWMADLKFSMRAKHENSDFACTSEQEGTLGQISMFQFFLFGDGYIDWFPGPAQDVVGRVHSNDDFCFSSGNSFRLSQVTAAKRLMHGINPECKKTNNASHTAQIATNADFNLFSTWTPQTDHDCVDCGGTDMTWAEYATATWGAYAQDMAHGVPTLRLPISGGAETQAGKNTNGDLMVNHDNSRVLIDPVLPGEDEDVRNQKFACKADIRLINGVWYLRENPTDTDPCDWPGTPIWSDHPGNFPAPLTDEDGLDTFVVGQHNLKVDRSWSTTPARFSYYRTDVQNPGVAPGGAMLPPEAGKTPVVSYGSLYREATSPPQWRPGHWVGSGNFDYCYDPTPSGTFPPTLTAVPVLDTTGLFDVMDSSTATQEALCGTGNVLVPVTTRLLNGTRSGFQDGHVQLGAPVDPIDRAKILPININVDAFIEALLDTSDGELGSYFGPGSLTEREFNGILYVTHTWPGALEGFPDNESLPPQLHGALSDPQQSAGLPAHPAGESMIPYPLCIAPGANTYFPDDEFDFVDTLTQETRFHMPSCDLYDNSNNGGSRPNAVRLFHARDLRPGDSGVLPKGLSVVTNLPLYVLGAANETSNAIDETDTNWKPFLVAGDQVMLLSNNWDDKNSRWDMLTADTTRTATETHHHIAMLSGWSESTSTVYGGGIENFPRYLEAWSGVNHFLRGSLVMGFHSVYYPWKRSGGGAYSPPLRQWFFDPHYELMTNQPPGAPRYDVYAVRRWRE